MNLLNVSDDYDSFTNSTQNRDHENGSIIIILKRLLLWILSGV